MDAKTFGVFLANIRKEKKMTQAQLAAKINVTDKAVSRWERGLGFPDITNMEPLADALEISLLELMRAQKSKEEIRKDQYSKEEVSELLQSAAQMSAKSHTEDKKANILAALVFLAVSCLAFLSKNANLGGALFTGGIAAGTAISGYYFWKNQNDAEGRRIYGALFAGLGVFFLYLCQILIPADWKYGHERLAQTVICYIWIVVLMTAVCSCMNRWKNKKKASYLIWTVLGLATAFFLLWNLGGAAEKRQNRAAAQTVARQYAITQFLQKFGIKESEISAVSVTYGAVENQFPEEYTVAFSYKKDNSGKDTDNVYGYVLNVNKDLDVQVVEQSEAIGTSVYGETVKK